MLPSLVQGSHRWCHHQSSRGTGMSIVLVLPCLREPERRGVSTGLSNFMRASRRHIVRVALTVAIVVRADVCATPHGRGSCSVQDCHTVSAGFAVGCGTRGRPAQDGHGCSGVVVDALARRPGKGCGHHLARVFVAIVLGSGGCATPRGRGGCSVQDCHGGP